MQNFTLLHPIDTAAATIAASAPGSQYIAGGTDLIQLMKDFVATPTRLVDIDHLPLTTITADSAVLQLGALARMSDVAAHAGVVTHYPVIAQALLASASPQLRNMGTMGGNMLQRTRCLYFRDPASPCNKRVPGSGCPAIAGVNRMLAIIGGSEQCIATHPSDLAVALAALDARISLQDPHGATRMVTLEDFHTLPADHPNIDTVLTPGELITGLQVDHAAPASVYVKVRDRASFEFAVVSVAVALDISAGTITRARLAAGGVAPKPWRLTAVEAALHGQAPTEAVFIAAASHAAEGARPQSQNGFKVKLLQNAVAHALRKAALGASP